MSTTRLSPPSPPPAPQQRQPWRRRATVVGVRSPRTLEMLISEFKTRHCGREMNDVDVFNMFRKKRKSLNKTIIMAATAICWPDRNNPDHYGKHPHQYRLSATDLKKVANALAKQSRRVRICKSFSELHDLIESVARELKADGRIRSFGRLAIYDTSVRIGAFLGRLPEEVYLHAGTREGARVLLGDRCTRRKALPLTHFHKLLRTKLKPYEIEDFLCIFRDELSPRMNEAPV